MPIFNEQYFFLKAFFLIWPVVFYHKMWQNEKKHISDLFSGMNQGWQKHHVADNVWLLNNLLIWSIGLIIIFEAYLEKLESVQIANSQRYLMEFSFTSHIPGHHKITSY